MLTVQAMVEKHRGEVEKIQTDLKSIRGEFAGHFKVRSVAFSPDGNVLVWDVPDGGRVLSGQLLVDLSRSTKAATVQAPMADRVKKVLDQEVDYELDGSDVASLVGEILAGAKADIPIRSTAGRENVQVNLKGKLAVGAWLQAIEDTDPNVRIVVRDYGLLITTRDKVPDGALRVQDLW